GPRGSSAGQRWGGAISRRCSRRSPDTTISPFDASSADISGPVYSKARTGRPMSVIRPGPSALSIAMNKPNPAHFKLRRRLAASSCPGGPTMHESEIGRGIYVGEGAIDVSICVPIFNEEGSVGELYRQIA